MISPGEFLFYMLILNAVTYWVGFLRGRTTEIKNKIRRMDELFAQIKQDLKKAGLTKPGGIV